MTKLANVINDYRVFPRVFLICFTLATGASIQWYLEFPLTYKVECNQTLVLGLVAAGSSAKEAEAIGCRPTEVMGRPNGYTALISTLVGACGLVFSFYTTSGAPRRDPQDAITK